MRTMSAEEWRRFILERPRPAIVAVTRQSGAPLASPVWIDLDGDQLVFTTWHAAGKAKALARDPRLSLCIQDDRPPFSYVTIDGVAALSDDPDEVRRWAGRLGARFMGEERRAEYAARNGVAGELLARVTILAVHAVAGVAE